MDIQVGKFSRYENSFGKITLYFDRSYVRISVIESRGKEEGPSANMRFSYGVHPITCPAFWELAKAFDGEAYTKEAPLFDPASDRIILRQSDYGEEHIVIMELDDGLLQLNLNGTHDHGSQGCVRNGGCFPRIPIKEKESPEVFKALGGLVQALAEDNKNRPYPDGWWLQ